MAKIFNKRLSLVIFSIAVFCIVPFFTKAQSNVDITVSARIAGTSTLPTPSPTPSPTTPPAFYGGGVYVSPYTQVIFSGQAYPFANITILKNENVIATLKASSDGSFEKTINAFPSGTFNFSIFAQDSQNQTSPTLSFTVPVLENKSTLISKIFIPPTIEATPTTVSQGQSINIFGQSFPNSSISLFIKPKNLFFSASTSQDGNWNYNLDTSGFASGTYTAAAQATDINGDQSDFSKSIPFSILKEKCNGADLNGDGKVNLVDFSILLYFWGQKNPANPCADLNGDGQVDIFDFSIMMYYWST